MATEAASSRYQAQQAALAILLARALTRLFPLVGRDGSEDTLTAAVAALVDRFTPIATTEAAEFYRLIRTRAGIPGSPTIHLGQTAPLEQVSTVMRWATQPLLDGQSDLEATQTKIVGAAEKLVADAARDTIIGTVQDDAKARGWARIPEADPCAFCALLSIRGAVYKSEQTADFKAHDHCRCHAEPVFGQYEAPARVRQWEADYYKATRGVYGMKNLQNAWRRHYEGRAPQA